MDAPTSSAAPPLPASPNWMQRNWPWFTAVMVLVVVGFVCGMFYFVTHLLKTSDAYVAAMEKVRTDSRAVAALGGPIKDDSFVTGKLKYNSSTSWAHLYTKLTGSKTGAHLEVYATRSEDQWVFHRITLTMDGTNEVLDIVKPAQ